MSEASKKSGWRKFGLGLGGLLALQCLTACMAEVGEESGQPYDDEEQEVFGTSHALEANASIVISQIYAAPAGSSQPTQPFNQEFVELFNRGDHAVTLNGWSIQYGSTTGNFGAGKIAIPTITLQSGQYMLIGGTKSGAGANIPTPSVSSSGGFDMSKHGGKLALVKNSTTLSCGSAATPCDAAKMATITDMIGWGKTTPNYVPNLYEGSGYAGSPGDTNAVWRSFNGCLDTNNNGFDTLLQAPAPRTVSTPRVLTCFNSGTTP